MTANKLKNKKHVTAPKYFSEEKTTTTRTQYILYQEGTWTTRWIE